jgi:tRNA (guanine26-N2/guanine27-N2)-dimethyltransferase
MRDQTGVTITEGRARVQFPAALGKVFYNPRMSINRDIAVLFARSHFSTARQLRVCDPMTGSGVRVARYLLETTNIAHGVAADNDPDAAKLAEQTIRLNGLKDRVIVVGNDAHTLLSDHAKDRFDIIDLDPFGSPAPFFECALRATAAGGVIAATATDMGPLSGARPTACLRKYGVSAVRTEFEKEIAVRALASCLLASASRVELGIDIAFSHTTDHYARLYAVVNKGRKAANQSLANLGYISYCPNCLSRNGTSSISLVQTLCVSCGAPTRIGGPFWFGPLWDRRTVESMIRRTPALASSRLSEVQKLLGLIQDEIDSPRFYYTTDSIASVYGVKPPSVASLIELLREDGHEATRTHFNPTGFRTNASLPRVVASFRKISEKSQS